ncbi:MAG: hypothetical protein N2B06_17000 [Clostridium sp.]|tara:strand:+ start:97 stop:732 length:636 start_codon:yes stop_codon:yes gene_type:complete
MSSPFQRQFTAKTPFTIEENPTKEKLGRETGSTKTTGDIYKGKETTTTYNQPVETTKAGDEAYAALSDEGKKAQDEKFLSNRTRKKSIKTSGLQPLTTPGITAELPDTGKIKENLDPIEKLKYSTAHGQTYGNTGAHAKTGYLLGSSGAERAGSMIKTAGSRGSTVIQGVRKSGELVDVFSKQNESMGGKGLSKGLTTAAEDVAAKKKKKK